MIISKGTVVSIDYTLRDDDENIIDKSDENRPLVYLQGSGNIIPGLEKAMEGKAEGETIEVRVSPEEGYGVSREEMIQQVPKDRFEGVDGGIQLGMQFQARTEDGAVVTVRVVKVDEETVTIDGNHPLANQHLNFVVGVREIRLASAEEVEQGHPTYEDAGCCGGGGGGCGCSEEKAEDCCEEPGNCGCSH